MGSKWNGGSRARFERVKKGIGRRAHREVGEHDTSGKRLIDRYFISGAYFSICSTSIY
jgi:hypothetical protein